MQLRRRRLGGRARGAEGTAAAHCPLSQSRLCVLRRQCPLPPSGQAAVRVSPERGPVRLP